VTTVQGQKVKGQGHVTYQQQQRYNSATNSRINFKLGASFYFKKLKSKQNN